jgi:lysylphosphatidylglycerol synthetase-like protein (DUF2156 family)
MPQTTVAFGVLLCLVGVGFYAGTGGASLTALIPAFLGLPLVVAGVLARREAWRRHAMHAAALLGMLGVLGSLRGALKLPALLAGAEVARPAAVAAQAITALLCLVFVALCVRSFVNARRERTIRERGR